MEAVKRYRPVPCAIRVAGVSAAAAIVYTALKEDSRTAANSVGYHAGLHDRAACVREPDANKERHIRYAGFPHDVGDAGMLLHHLCATEFIHFSVANG